MRPVLLDEFAHIGAASASASWEIDRSNPITRGLLLVSPPVWERRSPQVDLVARVGGWTAESGTTTSDWTIGIRGTPWGARQFVSAISTFDALNFPYTAMNAAWSASGNASIFVALRTDGTLDGAGDKGLLTLRGSGTSKEHYPFTDGRIYLGTLASARWVSALTPPTPIAQPHSIGFNARSGAQTMYFNGRAVATGTVSGAPALSSAARAAVGGNIFCMFFWDRQLTAAEHRWLALRWPELFVSSLGPRWGRFVPAASAGSTGQGSGVITGTGTLPGQGYAAHYGHGTVAGAGTLPGDGYAAHYGHGSVSGTGTLPGEGAAPALAPGGSGAVTGVGTLPGEGYALHSGYGSIAGVESLLGAGPASSVDAARRAGRPMSRFLRRGPYIRGLDPEPEQEQQPVVEPRRTKRVRLPDAKVVSGAVGADVPVQAYAEISAPVIYVPDIGTIRLQDIDDEEESILMGILQ